VVERFVRLIHLEVPVPEEAALTLDPLLAEVRCYLRDRVWQRDPSRKLLPTLLEAARRAGGNLPDYVHFLTDFMRSHRPSSREECLSFLENLEHAYEDDLAKHQSGSRSFFSEQLSATYAGKWATNEDVIAAHGRMIAMAQALRRMLS
jgi:hypothetical protein